MDITLSPKIKKLENKELRNSNTSVQDWVFKK